MARKVPGFAVADAFVRLDLAQLNTHLRGATLRLNAGNLFDKRHVTGCFNDTYCYYADERNASATLNLRF